MTICYFGPRWDAPMLEDDAEQVATPAGAICLYCDYPIAEGERGLLRPCFDGMKAYVRPAHMECELPSVFGGPDHVRGTCTHIGSCQDGWHDRRALGLATLEAINEQRAARGQDSL